MLRARGLAVGGAGEKAGSTAPINFRNTTLHSPPNAFPMSPVSSRQEGPGTGQSLSGEEDESEQQWKDAELYRRVVPQANEADGRRGGEAVANERHAPVPPEESRRQ